MEKKIKFALNLIKGSLITVWIVSLVIIVLGEMSCLADFAIAPHSNDEFICNGVAICLTIVGLPVIIKIFNLCTTRSLRRMDNDEAINRYVRYALVRSFVFAVIAMADWVAYYLTMNVTGAMCALSVLVISLVCWPKRKDMDNYLEKVNQE